MIRSISKQFASFAKVSLAPLPTKTKRNSILCVTDLSQLPELSVTQRSDIEKHKVSTVYSPENNTLRQVIAYFDSLEHKKIQKTTAKALSSVSTVDKETPLQLELENVSLSDRNSFIGAAIQANYFWGIKSSDKPANIKSLSVSGSSKIEQKELEPCLKIEDAVVYTRDLANTRASEATPEFFEKEAKKLASSKVKVEVITGEQLKKKGMNLIYSVGKAAESKPRLVTLTYKGRKGRETDYAIVGKGVTFDTGGLNMKSTPGMSNMHIDKHGACNALASFKALVEMKVPLNLVCCLALAENSVDSKSYRPSDILTSYKGITVEITNTDAEGRLCLADAFTHVQKKFKPNVLVDFATLTGAAAVAIVFW